MLNLQCRRFQSAQFQGGHQIIVSPIQYLTYSEIWSKRWVSARINSIKFWCGSRWSAEAGDFFSFFTLWYFFHILFNFIGNNELILMNKTQLYLGWYEWGLSCLGRDMRSSDCSSQRMNFWVAAFCAVTVTFYHQNSNQSLLKGAICKKSEFLQVIPNSSKTDALGL